ncbi:MAG TPA: type II secretion system protein GspL [Steroidobacteraceae bacterium]|nr:type II secretion system protein GspL [Steroidobacteraceae bacterium]
MAEALVIRFPLSSTSAEQPSAQWMLVDSHHNRMGAVVTGSLQEASGLAVNRKVLAVVNGATVLHTEPVLPPMKGGAKLAQIIPFALEDQLATDVDELHFAVGKRQSRPGTPIAVVAHEQIKQWVSELHAAGLRPAALYSDISTLPVSDDAITLVIDHGRLMMSRFDAPSVSLDIAPLSEALQLLLPEATETPVVLYIPEAEYENYQADIETLQQRAANLQVKLLPEGALPLYAAQALRADSLNLLQGAYEPKRDVNNDFRPWRIAALLVGVAFALHLVVTGARWWQLKRDESKLDQEITTVYSQGIPAGPSTNPAQARRAFESRLAALQSTGVSSPLLVTLSALSDAITKAPGAQVSDLSYRDNILNVRMMIPTVDALEQVRKQVASHGLTADIQSANPHDKQVEGRLQIKAAGAH